MDEQKGEWPPPSRFLFLGWVASLSWTPQWLQRWIVAKCLKWYLKHRGEAEESKQEGG